MALSLSRVTQVWGASLAELQPVPEDKLDVLLRVCGGDGGEDGLGRPKDAGEVLQRALPLIKFLDKAEGRHAKEVVPCLVGVLAKLPLAWDMPQNGPLQTQADFTQLMLDVRRVIRSPSLPQSAKQQLSSAVQQLLQELFAAARQQPPERAQLWVKCGAYLLLRALTRSPHFIADPLLPLLPADAFDVLTWLNANQLRGGGAAAVAASAAKGAAGKRPSAFLRAARGGGGGRAGEGEAAAAAAEPRRGAAAEAPAAPPGGAGGLLLKDDKFYLLVTKVIMTATSMTAEDVDAASTPATPTSAGGAAAAEPPAAAAAARGAAKPPPPGAGASAGGGGGGGRAKPAVSWGTAAAAAANGGTPGGSISDPALLCQVLEWSSTRVRQAMQLLLEPAGSGDFAPSREATTASAQLAATCIHALQAGPPLAPNLEDKLRQQVEKLLETALTVGEAVVASAATVADRDPDSDKLLALGARILAATTPFVAASAARSGAEQQLALTGRLQQLMLAAAQLAPRHGSAAVGQSASGGGGAAAAGGLPWIQEDPGGVSLHPRPTHLQPHPQHSHHWHPGGDRAHLVGGKLRAGASRLATRRAAKQLGFSALPVGRRGRGGRASGPPHQQQRQQRQQRHQPAGPARLRTRLGSSKGAAAPLGCASGKALLGDQGADGAWWGPLDGGMAGLPEGQLARELLAAEAEQQAVPGVDLEHPWSWDVTQPLTMLSEGVRLSKLPLSCGIGGFLLARAAAEGLCEALAASWSTGQPAPVRRLLLLPHGGHASAPEQAVTALAMGRLYVRLQADQPLGQLLLPLMADLLAQATEHAGHHHAGAFEPAAAAALAGGGGGDGSGRAPAAVAGGLSAEAAGAVVCALEGMASACVQYGKDSWLYDQALQLLLLLYREPTPLSLQLLSGRTAPPATAGLLADALHLLAVGLEDAPQRARADLRMKLLLLFSDVAARVGGASGVVAGDLGDLLMAVAVAAEGLRPRTLRLLGGSASGSRMSMHDIQTAQREDASTTRLFRNLWLYSAMHKLVNPSAAAAAADGRGARGAPGAGGLAGGVVGEWQAAAGRLAAVTPLMVVGTDSYHEADMVERLKVELGEQLAAAGSHGSASSLSASLLSLLGGRAALAGQGLPVPSEGVLLAFIVSVALAELSRAALAPLPDLDDDPVVSCPVSVTLGYLKGVLPDGMAAAWLAAIARRAASLYVRRLLALAARQEQEEEDEGIADMSSPGVPPAPALAYAEQLACALIGHLGGGGPGTLAPPAEGGASAPPLSALADELLELLLAAFPALHHSQLCYCALLVQLQQEEGDVPIGQVAAPREGRVWARTQAWVEAAAVVAPMTTEALLHAFLTGGDGLPGATPPSWLSAGGAASGTAGRGTSLTGRVPSAAGRSNSGSDDDDDWFDCSAGGLAGSGGAGRAGGGRSSGGAGAPAAGGARVASLAAFRRAADLLQTCQSARRRHPLGKAGEGAYEGALGLTRKIHYTGYVQGLMNGRGSAAAAAIMLSRARAARAATAAAAAGPGPGASAGGAAGVASLQTLRAVGETFGGAGEEDEASEATQMAVAEEITLELEAALQQPSPSGERLASAALAATALLALQPDAFTYSRLGLRLLGALAQAPLRHLTPSTMRLSQFTWCWVCVESPEVLVPLMSSIGSAWVWTLDQRLGLFSGGSKHMQQLRARSSAAGGAAGGGQLVVADDGSSGADAAAPDESTLQAVAAHFLWLSHLLETWAVVSRLRDGRAAAARVVYGRLLAASLHDLSVLSHHPAALGAYFRLLALGLAYGRACLAPAAAAAGAAGGAAAAAQQQQQPDALLLFDRILKAALMWFRSPPRYYARCTRQAAAEQLAALEAFMAEVDAVAGGEGGWPTYDAGRAPAVAAAATASAGTGSLHSSAPAAPPHPVWGAPSPSISGYVRLLSFLCGEELSRLRVWTDPLGSADAAKGSGNAPWREFVPLAWQVDPCLALCLLDHFPAAADLRQSLEALVVRHCEKPQVQGLPKAALLLATSKAAARQGPPLLAPLAVWTPGSAAEGLQLLSGPEGRQPLVRSYAVRCLFNERPEKLVFFLPQLVQLLRGDADGAIAGFFLEAARHSDLFAHQLIWALSSEAKPPAEAFNPEVKRSGWQPPKDTGLWDIAASVRSRIEQQMTRDQRAYWEAQGGYFEQVTALSGYLYRFSRDERRAKLQEALAGFRPPRGDLYVPTNPEARVVGHVPSSGACMQSAAKVPILVAFEVELEGEEAQEEHGGGGGVLPTMACIFKVGDDIRQDVLAMQVIRLLHGAFEAAGLGLYLRPYGCLPTGYECGIIEVVPRTKSRAALGELSDRGLHDIFAAEFGAPGSAAFEAARENFIVSEAAYAVASYLLQAKDRHNGNIMIDDVGHIVHIDFGFILEISPGGNMGFESAAFKLSHEMTQVMDPGGRRSSPQLNLFEELVIRAYLAARTVAEPIIASVSLMADSGLPCFSRGAPVANLRRRFHLEMSDAQAAAFMRAQISDAYGKWTTGFYDYIQAVQNKIPY